MKNTMAWLIGYFIFFWPITYARDGSLITGLVQGIIGLAIAILILWRNK